MSKMQGQERSFMKNNNQMILIVDDSMENLQILGEMLGESGYSVAMASDGLGALEFLKEEKPDLILMDIMMPGLSGIHICQNIKQSSSTQNLPIIFISALTQTADKINAFEAGGSDFITKPFQRDEVLARVKTHIAMKKTMDENLEHSAELEKMNNSKDMFFSIISHDLRSQIGGITGICKLLSRKVSVEGLDEIKPFSERLESASTKLYSLLENLLSWASYQKQGMKFEPSCVDIYVLVECCIQSVIENAKLKQISIENHLKATDVLVDENMISTVVRNLLSNAIKFTKEGGTIMVSGRKVEENYYEIAVKDTGVGIDSKVKERLFTISEKITTLGTNLEEGSGLGLILCKEFVEMNGGLIKVNSQKNVGSTIRFTVPLASQKNKLFIR